MNTKLIALLGAAALVTTLTGCGVSGAPATKDASAPAPATAPSAAPAPAKEEPKTMTLGFGEIFTYENGVSISASAPAAYTPGQYAAGADQAHQITFNVTITNGSKEPLEPMAYGTLASGGVEGSQIFDSEKGLNGGPTTVILPGGTITWPEAYSVADPASLILQISPSFEYENAIFTNQ